MKRAIWLIVFVVSFTAEASGERVVELGQGLMAVVHEPEESPIGLVVIAPGAGYDMDQPLMKQMAEAAAANGYRTLRFNWRFYTAGKERKPGLRAEVADLKHAVDRLRNTSGGLDHIVLIGKSLGSIVVSEVGLETRRPMILLTPVCRSAEEFTRFYPPAETPVVMIAGDHDPLCDVSILFDGVDRATKVAIVEGDHSFQGPSDADSHRNLNAVVDLVSYWLAAWRP